MNPRIRELWNKAKVNLDEDFSSGRKSISIPKSYDEMVQEKFAELVIRECAELTLSHRNDDYYNGWLDYRDEIRRHFGVAD